MRFARHSRFVWETLGRYGLGARNIGLVALMSGVVLVLYYKFPDIHVDAVATILGVGIAIPGLLISIRLLLDAKSASDAARDAAVRTSRELESLEAYRRSTVAIGDIDRLKASLIKRDWVESRSLIAAVLAQLRSVRDGGLALAKLETDGLDAAIKAFEAGEIRLAAALLNAQELQNSTVLFKSLMRHVSFLSELSGRLRRIHRNGDDHDR